MSPSNWPPPRLARTPDAHPGLGGPFVILEFDGYPAIVHLENRRGSAGFENDDDIAEAKRVAAPETNRAHPRQLVGSAG
jgi:hypothetical protein